MADDQDGRAVGHLSHIVNQSGHGGLIEMNIWFIKDEQPRLAQQGARHGNPLALPA